MINEYEDDIEDYEQGVSEGESGDLIAEYQGSATMNMPHKTSILLQQQQANACSRNTDEPHSSRSLSVYSSFGIMKPGINQLNQKFSP